MRTFAYCTESAKEAVAAATATEPLTSPPMTAAEFDAQWLEGHDLLYFRLHGMPGRRGWFGDSGQLALTRVQIEAADLCGSVVVVANCYSADDDPMIPALYRAGVLGVIAGSGENIAASNRVVGADLLVQWVIRGLWAGLAIQQALGLAQARLNLTSWRESDRDAMAFRIIEREEQGGQAKVA